MALFIAFFSLVILRAVLSALKRKPQMGAQRFVGEKAFALTDLSPDGKVMIQHQNWSATSIGGNVQKGQEVLVVSVSGVRLMVSPIDENG
jgi:membrane-bound ClpP family serine protease